MGLLGAFSCGPLPKTAQPPRRLISFVQGRLPLVNPETANALADQRIRELEQQPAESRELAATRHDRLTAAEVRLQAVTEERDRLWAVLYAALPGRPASASATACGFSATPGHSLSTRFVRVSDYH